MHLSLLLSGFDPLLNATLSRNMGSLNDVLRIIVLIGFHTVQLIHSIGLMVLADTRKFKVHSRNGVIVQLGDIL